MMLNQPPPGYNTNDINAQTIGRMSVPGLQGSTAQGYYDPYSSSYGGLPSNYSVPSSVDAPNPWYSQQPSSQANMVAALRGQQ